MAVDVSHLFSGIVGGLLAASANYAAQRWRYKTDELAAFWKTTCDDIDAVAKLATEYWLKDLSPENAQDQRADAAEAELRIVGYQTRLSLMKDLLEGSKIDMLSIDPIFYDFFDALSGGDFSVPDRAPDRDRALAVQDVGAQLIVRLRGALRRRTKLF